MKKIPKLTIGIPAYNEEANIANLLNSILKQKHSNFQLEKVIVISDGSNDKTVLSAKSVKDKRIMVIDDRKNEGRVHRLNQIIKMARTEVLVFVDGDEIFVDTYALQKIVEAFKSDDMVAVVGGNPHTVFNNSFLAKSQELTRDAYTFIRYQIKNGNNIYGCMGGFYAISNKLYKQLVIPEDVFADDAFTYLTCLTMNYKFVNARNILINHYLPDKINLHVKRNSRHSKAKAELKKYFGELVDQEYYIPKQLFIHATLKQFLRYPFHSTFIFGLNMYSRLKSIHDK